MNIYQAQPKDVDKILPLFLAYREFYDVGTSVSRRVILFCNAYSLMNRLFSLLKLPTKSWDLRNCIRCSAH